MDFVDESSISATSQRILKIIVVGDMGTGKTCLICRFVKNNFSEFYRLTIGVDFANKIVQWNSTTSADVQLWDIAGQERFGNMTSVYYREAVGAIVVFDVTRGSTRELVPTWKKDIDDKVRTANGDPVPTLLIGNKIDLLTRRGDWEQTRIEIEQFTQANGFLHFFETSAKDGTNLEESIMVLVDHILKNGIESEGVRSEKGVNIGAAGARTGGGGSGCC
jgi:small GTP-binding protein